MATCDYAESLNNSTKEADYNRLQTFFVQKRDLFNTLIRIIEDDNSTDAQIQQAKNDYDNLRYSGDSPLLNIDCCKNSDNDYFYNIRTQTCIIPELLTGYKKYKGLSRGSDPGFSDNLKYSTKSEAETKCSKICNDYPDECDSFEILTRPTGVECRYYQNISNKYTIDERSDLYAQTTETQKPFPIISVIIGISIGILFILFIVLIVALSRKKTPTSTPNRFGRKR